MWLLICLRQYRNSAYVLSVYKWKGVTSFILFIAVIEAVDVD